MSTYSLSHLDDRSVLSGLATSVSRERGATAEALAHIAEVDARRLYLPGPSMHAYCVQELHFSKDEAFKRILVARAARKCPALLPALAEGRLHFTGAVKLAPHLTPENQAELLAAATHKTKAEIEQLLAEWFPRLDVPAGLHALPASPVPGTEPTTRRAGQLVPEPVEVPAQPPKLEPLSPRRIGLNGTIDQATHEKMQYAQALFGPLPAGDPLLIDRAYDALIRELEKTRFAATTRPRSRSGRAIGIRTIPNHVKRAVWERDGGQCTFVSEGGRRCLARKSLEYDHEVPVARGGAATVENLHLKCRAHNQYAAEQTFGAEFMSRKREARRAAGRAAQHAPGHVESPAAGQLVPEPVGQASASEVAAGERARVAAAARSEEKDVTPWLRKLGYRADEARRAAEVCERIPDATLEERIRLALSYLCPPHRRVSPAKAT
ncbi:MAG TPA: hypothetical protein VGK89_08875 [Candidatus Eisenbacteria bacterium]|jgi:5-methylcytosine-specific restriction endonuclease McrA